MSQRSREKSKVRAPDSSNRLGRPLKRVPVFQSPEISDSDEKTWEDDSLPSFGEFVERLAEGKVDLSPHHDLNEGDLDIADFFESCFAD